jgi:hypothetical protein
MTTLVDTANSITELEKAYNKTHSYQTFASTPDTSRQNAILTPLCNISVATMSTMTLIKPLPDEYEDTEHTDDSAIHSASAYLAKTKRIEEMTGFSGTETPGMYYRIIKAHAFRDSAFFLKPQLNVGVNEGFGNFSSTRSWSEFFAPIFGFKEGLNGIAPPSYSGLHFTVAEGFMNADTSYFGSNLQTQAGSLSTIDSTTVKSKIIASGTSGIIQRLNKATSGVITNNGEINGVKAQFSILFEGWLVFPFGGSIKLSLFARYGYVWFGESSTPIISCNSSSPANTYISFQNYVPISANTKYYIRIMFGYDNANNNIPGFNISLIHTLDGTSSTGSLPLEYLFNTLPPSVPTTTNTPGPSVPTTTNTPGPSVPTTTNTPGPSVPTAPYTPATSIISSSYDSQRIPPICPDIFSNKFKQEIKQNGKTFAFELFGYLVADVSGIYSLRCTNGVGIIYSARIWIGDTALVSYISDNVGAWNGWADVSSTTMSVKYRCNAGDRIPIRVIYTQNLQPIDAYDFIIALEIESNTNQTQSITPTFVVRKDTYGEPYEPAQLTILKYPIDFPITSSETTAVPDRVRLRHFPIVNGNNWQNNSFIRSIFVQSRISLNMNMFNVLKKKNNKYIPEDTDPTANYEVQLFPNGNLVVNGKTYRPQIQVPTCAPDESICGCVMYLTDTGNVVIDYNNSGTQTTIQTFGSQSTRQSVIQEEWMLDKDEWPILGSPQHLSKGHYLSQSPSNTEFVSFSTDGSPAIFDANTRIYSRNGKYRLGLKSGNLIMFTNTALNPARSCSVISLVNKSNIIGGTYLFEHNASGPSTRYLIPHTAEILGQNGTYSKYDPINSSLKRMLVFPPKVMAGSTAYTKRLNVSAQQCAADCDNLKTGCSHYFAITEQSQPGCVLNIDGNDPVYLPNPVSSQITSSNLYTKNRIINSNCNNINKQKLITNMSTNNPTRILPTHINSTFYNPTLNNEGACGDSTIQQNKTQLGSLNSLPQIDSFVGYNENDCTLGDANSIAVCKARLASNMSAIGQYTASHEIARLNQNANDIRILTNNLIGGNTNIIDGTVNRYTELNGTTILNSRRSAYLNPRDIILTTPEVRLNDVKKDVSQQNTQFIMGIAASVAIGLFAASVALK